MVSDRTGSIAAHTHVAPKRLIAPKRLVSLACAVAFSLAATAGISCSAAGALPEATLIIEKKGGGSVRVRSEIARTETEQEKGYMGREVIPDGTGMLFAYDADRKMRFWMKNTPHPLSIAYIDSSGTIRQILDMSPFSHATVESAGSVRYALEVPQGWFARVGVAVGDRISAETLSAALKAR